MSSDLMNKKLEYWEHKLLDLGKRNKMINYRETKRTTIKLIEPSFEELFNRLAINEETLTFQRAVDRETDVRVFSILSLLENLSASLPVTIGDIKTEGSILERQATLKNLRAKSRLSLEEQGTNILYLSFGFIEWKDGKGASAQWLKSPLILIPAVLTLEALNSPYTLKKHEDDIVVNPTLEYYLKSEYGVEIPQFDSDKDSIDSYLKSLEAIADQRGWRILKEVSLGLLSFLKITMYNDLLRNEERIRNNPVVRAMTGDSAEANEIPESISTFELDSISTQDCYQVMSADSSQQEAILYSKNNISFVMQGPPGTGKSQTITNIIAEALAEGKKVLFVSEKMAALQVVYKRLQEAHLGDFCLPLHSYKANKKEILEQIGSNLSLSQTRVKDTAINNLEELLLIRKELNSYASELHALNPELNISCYEAYINLEKVCDVPTVPFSLCNPLEVSQAELQKYLNALHEYSLTVKRLNYNIKDNPWDGLSARTSGFKYAQQMKTQLILFTQSILELTDVLCLIEEVPILCEKVQYSAIPELAELMETVCGLPAVPQKWLNEFDFENSLGIAEKSKAAYAEAFVLSDEISRVFNDNIYDFDYNGWKERLQIDANNIFLALPYINTPSPEYYIKNANDLLQIFYELKSLLSNIERVFAIINDMLGTDLDANADNQQIINSLYELVKTNIAVNKNWFESDLAKVKSYILKAQTAAENYNREKDALLKNWESEVLTLDYSPILLRYKTDYNGFFKILNSQYRQDQKKIQSLSKTVIKKLNDETAIELLSAIKQYQTDKNWFDDNKDELQNTVGKYYNGIDTDWQSVFKAMEIADSLKKLPLAVLPLGLIELVSKEHSAEISRLNSLLNVLKTSFVKAERIINNNNLIIDIDSADFDIATALNIIEVYISKLSEISAQAKLLHPYLLNTDETIDTIYSAIKSLNLHKDITDTISSLSAVYSNQYEFLFDAMNTDWNTILELINCVANTKKSSLFDVIKPLFNITAQRKDELHHIINSIGREIDNTASVFDWICKQFTADSELQRLYVKELSDKLNGCLLNIDSLESWIDYQEAKEKCINAGLNDLIKKYELNYLDENIEKIFLKGFYQMWLESVCEKSDSVRRFRRNVQDERVRKFIELDDLQLLISQMRIREKLIEALPSAHRMLKATDEVAILNKELIKKRNIMPLRKLFKQIPNLLMKLKPCLMMSPLSVSYFLETEAYHFDLVIFDEASQIFPEDAIGAIFRGSQVIIAGDSKQLPPTNFFSSSTNGFDSDYDVKDDEDYNENEIISDSILEETASVLPGRTLLWHYRSKNEDLIAFSNREIYDYKLITFPNSINNVPDFGVEYVYVEDGCYDRGGKRNNIREVQECVRLVIEHIEKHPERSLGIIAFSESQQATLEDAITDFRERNPEYEWFFDEAKDEPFFIKNLESVQGDERDVIIFSICYGKDKNRNMYMNFGPVGHNGGERRLNVAVTRAKCSIKLVGSILPSDIDMSRAKSEGVRMLRSYIEYAINGSSVFRSAERSASFDTEDEFCETVAVFLESHGYKIERKIGCSDYKIDMAIVNPESEGEYIAGIECDGLSYIRAKTARDRDHLRKSVLQNMGWNLYRVWSTEWNRNPKAEGEALLNFIESVYDKKQSIAHTMKQTNSATDKISIEAIAAETVKTSEKTSANNIYDFDYYKEADWLDSNLSNSYDNFTRIGETILHVVSVEQPIHLELLYKRMGPAFSSGKATEAVKTAIDQVIAQTLTDRVVVDDNFVRLLPLTPASVRIPKKYSTPRPIEYIHTEEAAMAMLRIVSNSFGITEDDLASEAARVFGYERKGPKIKIKTDAAIKFLVDNNMIRIIDGKVQLVG